MKKVLFCILFFAILLITPSHVQGLETYDEVYVGGLKSPRYATLEEALLRVKEDGTIYIGSTITVTSSIQVNKSVKIKSASQSTPLVIIDNSNLDRIFNLNDISSFVIENIHFRGGLVNVIRGKANHISITNSKFESCNPLYIRDGSDYNILMEGNTLDRALVYITPSSGDNHVTMKNNHCSMALGGTEFITFKNTNLDIRNNTFIRYSLILENGMEIQAQIRKNTFSGNTGKIVIKNQGDHVYVRENHILKTSAEAVSYYGSKTADFTYNWWGSEDGPPHNIFVGNVDYSKWALSNDFLKFQGTEFTRLNDTANRAFTPTMTVYNDVLYVAWVELADRTQVRVKKYDYSEWDFTDQSGSLNNHSDRNAYNPVLAVHEEGLYLAWYEESETGVYQVFVRKYNPGSSTWGAPENISYGHDKAFNVKLVSNDNILYAIWVESNGLNNQIRVKAYLGETWTNVQESILNYNETHKTSLPTVSTYQGVIYAAWSEKGNIRVKQQDGINWSTADHNTSLNYDTSKFADMPILLKSPTGLFIIWGEKNENDKYQVRAKKYSGGIWEGLVGSLNIDPDQNAYMLNGVVYGDILLVTWTEGGKTKIKKYASDEWTTGDGINHDVSKASSSLTFQEYKGKLFMAWMEGNPGEEKIFINTYQD